MTRLIRPYVPETYVEIGAVAIARQAIEYALRRPYPANLVGKPGYGKTTALWHLSMEYGGTYCPVSQTSKSAVGMYRLILDALGIYHSLRLAGDLLEKIIESFDRRHYGRSPKPVLIVDEVQTLEATALRELLNIQETCGLALVMAGNGERLAARQVDHAAWEQIERRIGMTFRLLPLTKPDCDALALEFNVEGADAFAALTNFGTQTHASHLVRLLEQATILTGGTTGVRLEHIRSAANAMFGASKAAKLLKPKGR